MEHKFFLLSLLLTLFPSNYASSVHSNHIHRRQSVPSTLPSPWTSKGCYTDGNPGGRTLAAASYTSGTAMTVESCIAFCDSKSYIFAGVEYSGECYCDNLIQHGGASTALTDCNMPCSGNAAESCGAGNRLNVFTNGKTPPSPPITVPQVGNWVSLGCYSDNVNGNGRTLTIGQALSSPVTIETCTAACFSAGYRLSGAEYSGECYCGPAIANGGAPTPIGDCSMLCAGNSSEFCGGPNRLNLYNYTATDIPQIGGPAPGAGAGAGGAGAGLGASGVGPVTAGLPTPWKYAACYVDNAHGRVFEVAIGATATNTVESCIASCQAQNYTLAGMEFGQECYCGNRLVNGAVTADETTCNMPCAGKATEACGAGNRLSVYTATGTVTALPVPVAQTTGLPGKWTYSGCYTDTNTRVLPWQIIWPTNNTALACINQCAAFGYTAAGTEYGQECYCGDTTDVTVANGAVKSPESDCNVQCPGDPLHLCGGGLRLSLYQTTDIVNVWHTPANTGRYQFFVPGVIVPLIATLGINNKVTFLEKAGTGAPNTTGAYELDLSLVNNFSKTWREMHVKTDVFCSGSIILPDKGGRQINVGGWSGDSTFGVRLYTPSGVPGVNGTTDWQENGNLLKLQRARWYPTASILANGSIVVIGGEIGSNDKPQPNLEILPTPTGGDTTVSLDWLARTDPWNLYPFVVVLPTSGNLFIAYYNEARILDAKTFQTVKVLPNIPGAVNNFDAGRTYPLEGSMTLLPQKAPYTDPLTVLICGGSTPGPANVLDNCVTIQPESANPTWTVERMPSRRVMPCMANLPDGTTLIVNGAHAGVAGFGLASDPNFSAVLYDPTQPVGQRFSILGNTIVPRLYHSEAILLPDGQVLISGSDPQTPGFPEEYRIETYIPPYLNLGIPAPTFSITNKDWTYGQSVQITNVKVTKGIAAVKISLVAAVSSTHGNAMGSRTIFPASSCSGTTCTITAPPNAKVSPPGWWQLFILDGGMPSHSQWVRIGGDPAKLGNWPQLPGFTQPGV